VGRIWVAISVTHLHFSEMRGVGKVSGIDRKANFAIIYHLINLYRKRNITLMIQIENEEGYFRRFQTFIVSRMVPPSVMLKDSLIYWRVRILFAILLTGLVLCFFALIPFTFLAIKEKLWGLAIFNGVAYLGGIGLLLSRRPRYEIRAAVTLLMFYAVGLVLIVSVGPLSGGPAWLFVFAALVGVLLGSKAAIAALGLNAITLTIIGWLISTGRFGQAFQFFNTSEAMVVAGANFMLLNAVTAISVAVLVKGLVSTHEKERTLITIIEQERKQLIETKKSLEIEAANRKQTEEAMQENEEKYRNIFENAIEGIFQSTPEGRYININPALTEIYGYESPEDLINNITDIEHQLYVDPNSRKQLINLLKNKDSLYNFESQVYRKDGSVIWTSENIRAIRNELGELINYEGSVIDISNRRQAEEALRESEERANKYLEIASVAFVALNNEGNIALINERGLEILGYKREELLGKNWFKTCLPESVQDDVLDVFHQLIRGEIEPVEYYENPILRKDGKERIIAWSNSVLRNPAGEIEGTLTSGEDITERKQAVEALRESEEKYRTILDSIEDGYFEVDIAGNFTFFNNSLCKLFGITKDELMGKNFRDFADKETNKKGYQAFNKIYTTGKPAKGFNWDALKKDGTKIYIEASVSLRKDSEGKPIGFRGIIRDVSEHRQAEEEKVRLEAQLKQAQKMEAIGTLAGGIAHDFNNLLTGIQGRASLMLMHTATTNSHYEHLKGIEDYVKSAADLTKQLLAFARGGKYEVRPTDLNELIKNQNCMFGRTKKEIAIRGKYEKDLWAAEVDQGQIAQVMLNLYVNSWQSMSGGGDLYIQTENVALDENYTKPFEVKPGKYVKISVTDTGVGMDEATRQRIFDPFFTTKEMGRGTGLGLASVYGIIKNHEGFINVYSEKGEGTTFNIYLPASEKKIIEEKELAKEVIKGTETVLLVDDENVIIYAVERLLKEMGYKTLIARSGKEAVKIYKKNKDKIDVVILDMIMPDMGGGETYDRLKEINPDIKVLLSSGYSINGEAKEILKRGCNGFIQKPYRSKELSQKIREILDKD